jgi:hypothetical protein
MIWHILFAVLCALVAYQYVVFMLLPAELANADVRGDYAAAIKRLEIIARLPSLLGGAGRVNLLYYPGDRCASSGRYPEALAWFARLSGTKWRGIQTKAFDRRHAWRFERTIIFQQNPIASYGYFIGRSVRPARVGREIQCWISRFPCLCGLVRC